jgi:hypothetical protein
MKPTRYEKETLTTAQIEAIDKMTENAREIGCSGTCGHGYALPSYPVHLHHSVLNDLERLDTSRVTDKWWESL